MPTERWKARQKVFVYQPVGMDLWDHKAPLAGTRVVKTHPGGGAPPNGTMGHCYIAYAETGEFIGLRLLNSLKEE